MDWESFYNSFRKPGFIAGYDIQNRLGGGAFGDVYKAHKQSIGKAYAIKFLKIEDDTQRAAVERELSHVRHFAAIDHPNLVSIEDLGTVMGVPYLIMGYAGEETLARRLKGGALAPEEALLYFVQTCRGVLALHDRRLVHFDLKPSNVFLKGDVARVGDYGLSKLLTDGRMTLSYGRGTPQYMAPEMLRNRADQRADIYSLGVILYESLTGKLPFEGDHLGGLVLREEDGPPPFPEGFPARLRPTLERCLRLAPEDRFESVEELLASFEQTARPGDSVRLDWSPPVEPAVQPAVQPAADVPAAADDERATPRSAEELRRTAADLARGAALVARGVWEGLRSASETPSGDQASTAGAAAVSSASTLTPSGAGQRLSRAGAGLQRELEGVGHDLERASEAVQGAVASARGVGLRLRLRGRRGETRGEVSDDLGLPGPAAESMRAGAGTVPVPPRVEGGWVGMLFATGLLGLEVLMSLVGGLLRGAAWLARGTGEWLARSGGWLGRVLRLVTFLVVMALLGAAVMTAGLLYLGAPS